MNRENALKIVDIVYKAAVILLLLTAVTILRDIRSQRVPTVGDIKDAKNNEARKAVVSSIPVVFVQDGQVDVNGSVSIDGPVEIAKE